MAEEKPEKKAPAKGQPKRRKKRPGKPLPPRKPPSILVRIRPWLIGVVILVVVVLTYQSGVERSKQKALGDKYNLSLSALDKIHLGCKVFWREKGNYNSCSQSIVEEILGSLKNKEDVEITVVEGRSHKFTVRAKHREDDKIFQVDKEGKISLDVNGCLVEVRYLELTPEDVKALESKCPATGP